MSVSLALAICSPELDLPRPKSGLGTGGGAPLKSSVSGCFFYSGKTPNLHPSPTLASAQLPPLEQAKRPKYTGVDPCR